MALINCPECEKQISNKAATCPNCGVAIADSRESRGSGVAKLTTTQSTSKSLKAQTITFVVIFFIGMWLALGANDPSWVQTGAIMAGLGFIGVVITKIRTWWHHG